MRNEVDPCCSSASAANWSSSSSILLMYIAAVGGIGGGKQNGVLYIRGCLKEIRYFHFKDKILLRVAPILISPAAFRIGLILVGDWVNG